MVGAGGDVYVGGEDIFLLARATMRKRQISTVGVRCNPRDQAQVQRVELEFAFCDEPGPSAAPCETAATRVDAGSNVASFACRLLRPDVHGEESKQGTHFRCSLYLRFHPANVPVTYTRSPGPSHSITVGTVGWPSGALNSSPRSSSSAVVLLSMDERRGRVPSGSPRSRGLATSAGDMMGEPGVRISCSMGRGRRGGRL